MEFLAGQQQEAELPQLALNSDGRYHGPPASWGGALVHALIVRYHFNENYYYINDYYFSSFKDQVDLLIVALCGFCSFV